MTQNRQDSSIDRNSYERKPIFDPYGSSRSYGYDQGSSSFSKEKGYKVNLGSSSKNSYAKMREGMAFEVSQDGGGNANSHRLNYSVGSEFEGVGRGERSGRRNEGNIKPSSQNYTGVIAAGSGSVSSTKIKKELEGRRKKKFKKIEYLNKSKVGVSSMHATTAIKIGSNTPSSTSGGKFLPDFPF